MDMADAFNVMLYTSNCADGSPGYAVWDPFYSEDSDKIRDFLRKKFTLRPSAAMTKGQHEEILLTSRRSLIMIPFILNVSISTLSREGSSAHIYDLG